jgi:dihydroorotase
VILSMVVGNICSQHHVACCERAHRRNNTRMYPCSPQELTITQPDDWHLHLRDGGGLASAAPYSAASFRRAIIMPNLVPPVTTPAMARDYRRRIVGALPPESAFEPLMTLYLTDNTTPEDVQSAQEAGIIAFKLYPAGATTNSDSGVTDIAKVEPTLRAMAELGVVLCVHGEATNPEIDIFDREKVFIGRMLEPLLARVPGLRVVMEHITTRDAAEFVQRAASRDLAATITPQHVLHNRNALFAKGLRPHFWCLPVLKREEHR